MKLHRALGISLVAIGAVLLLGGVTVERVESTGELASLAFGGFTAAVGLAFLLRTNLSTEAWDAPTIERGILVPRPENDLLAAGEPASRDRFRKLVAEALTRDGYSSEEANSAIADGTWTSEMHAAEYLRARPPEELPSGDVLEIQREATLTELERVRQDHD